MNFSIEKAAETYLAKRFPRASDLEKRKVINDWNNKILDSIALVKDFKRRIGDPKDKKIIDVGSGSGGVSIAFSQAGALVSGVDIEKELYEISKAHAESYGVRPDFHLYDGIKLPFENNTFDYGISVSVLEHTDDPISYLKEILRVLKPGGFLYLGFPNKLAPVETHTQILFLTYLPAFLRPIYIKILRRSPLEDNNLHFYNYFDLKRMLRVIKKLDDNYWYLVPEKGSNRNPLKTTLKWALNLLGIPYKAFLPHILVILEKRI